MMKHFLYILTAAIFLQAGLYAAAPAIDQETNPVERVSAGGFPVDKYYAPDGSVEGLLAAVASSQPKRKIWVNVGLNHSSLAWPRDHVASYEKNNPAYDEISRAVFAYLPRAWQKWRVAANAYLPEAYRLPEVEFVYRHDYDVISGKQPNTLVPTGKTFIRLFLESGEWGLGASEARGRAMPRWKPDGSGSSYIYFLVQQQWLDYFNAKRLALSGLDALAVAYAKAVEEFLSGTHWLSDEPGLVETDQTRAIRETRRSHISKLLQSPADTWHIKGPWAVYNQAVMTHELGHLFLLPHVEEKSSIMYYAVSGASSGKVSDKDGLRLATLVCWYRNREAGREICRPIIDREAMEKNRLKLTDSLRNARKRMDEAAGRSVAASSGQIKR